MEGLAASNLPNGINPLFDEMNLVGIGFHKIVSPLFAFLDSYAFSESLTTVGANVYLDFDLFGILFIPWFHSPCFNRFFDICITSWTFRHFLRSLEIEDIGLSEHTFFPSGKFSLLFLLFSFFLLKRLGFPYSSFSSFLSTFHSAAHNTSSLSDKQNRNSYVS